MEKTKTRKITVEAEIPVVEGAELDVEELLRLLRRGVPLNVRQSDLKRSKLYGKRTRY